MKKLLLFGISFIPSVIFAAGFQLNEYSARNLGRAFAGIGVVGDDYSALGYNPAGMILNKTSGMQTGGTYVAIRSHVMGKTIYKSSGLTENIGTTSPHIARIMPHFFSQYKLNEKITLGLGYYNPFGLATNYNKHWFANTHGLLSEIQVGDFASGVSYNLHPNFAIGMAGVAQKAEATIKSAYAANPALISRLEGDDVAFGWQIGTLWHIPKFNVGLSYRSQVVHTLKGKINMYNDSYYSTSQRIYTKLTTPEILLLSAYWQATKKLGLSATARWTRWSQFNNLNIYNYRNMPISTTDEDWKNTWYWGLGGDYQFFKNFSMRLGAAYDESSIKLPNKRTVRIPDGRRIWTSCGLSYTYNHLTFDLAFSHLYIKRVHASHSSNETPTNIEVRYSSRANLIGFQMQYSF